MSKPIIILTPRGAVQATTRGEKPVLVVSSFEHTSLHSPNSQFSLREADHKPVVVFISVVGNRIRSINAKVPRVPGMLINPANHARQVSYRGGCWIGNRHFLLSIWEYFPCHPLIAEFEIGQDARGRYKVELIDTMRIPKSTEGGCIENMGFDLDTNELLYTSHMDERVQKVTLKELKANRAIPVG